MALSEKQLSGLMQKVISAAKKLEPKAEVLVSAQSSRFAHIRFARNTVTTSGEIDEAHLGVTIKLGQKVASASSNQSDDGSIAALVERTSRAAHLAPEDPEAIPFLGAQLAKRNDQVFDPTVDAMDAKGRAQLVKAALEPGKARGLAVAGFFAQNSGVWGKATSAGLLHVHPATGLELTVTARTRSGTGSGRGNFHGRRLGGLNAEEIATRACEIAVRSENPRKLEPGRYTVVLEPLATATLCETLLSAMDQRSADEGRSFFAGKKSGDAIASSLVTLRSDPRSPRTPMLPFDGEGRVLETQPWITGGKLEALGTSRFWAAKTRRKPTGGHSGLELLGGATPRAKLIEGVKRGVLISRFWYTNWVDGPTLVLTGLTRDGTFLIEDGRVTTPVNNFRFNQSLADAFRACDGLSSEVESPGDAEVATPTMRTHDFLLASVSEAV